MNATTITIILLCVLIALQLAQLVLRRIRSGADAIEVRDERRDDAASIQQAVFYDLTERRRLWSSNSTLRALCFVLAGICTVSICSNFWLVPAAAHAVTFGIAIHDNGDVTPLGPLGPDDSPDLLQYRAVAGHLIENLHTVSNGISNKASRHSVECHVAAGSPASTFIDNHYKNTSTNPDVAANNNEFQTISILDVGGSHDGLKNTVTFLQNPVDRNGHPTAGTPQRRVAHIELVHNHTGDVHALWCNPNEIYATYIDEDGPQQ